MCLLIILFQIASCTRMDFYYWSVAATAVERFQPDLPKLLGDEYCTWLTEKMCLPFFFFFKLLANQSSLRQESHLYSH